MKQKLLTGFSLMAVAGVSFWACGDGSINKMDEADGLMAMQYPDHDAWVNFKEEQKNACKADMDCYIQYQGYIDGTELPPEDAVSSSSEEQQQQQQTRLSSAQGQIDIDNTGPTSSATIIDPGQQTSSSSAGTPVTGLGDCKPVTSPIDKGGSVAWQFVGNTALYKPMEFATFTYEWDFGELGTGVGFKTDVVTYPNSGKYTATVKVTTKDGNTETKVCKDSLQVNGAKITGCTCTTPAAGTSVNFLETSSLTWSVTGCSSVGANITTYAWDGGAAGTETSFTKNFTAAAESYAPTLKVANDDNTEITVPCDAVKITEGAEYTIKEAQNAGAIPLPAGASAVVLEASGYNNTVFCNANGPITGSVNGVELNGSYYVAVQLPAGTLVAGATLDFNLDHEATCGIQ